MRKQYHFRPSPNGLYAWDVYKLVALTERLTAVDVPLSRIKELDENYWFDHGTTPTPRNISKHIKLIHAVDMSYPIILCAKGRVMDGMHRCVKALISEHATISAVQFAVTPEPDYTDVQPNTLPYD